jgi:hypothetical protein
MEKVTAGWRSGKCGASCYILFSMFDQNRGEMLGGAGSRHGRDGKCIKNLVQKN